MPAHTPREDKSPDGTIAQPVNRREFLKRAGLGTVAASALVGTTRPRHAAAATYPDWIAASTKPAKRGGTLTRASAWDPPMLDPRLTQSVGLFQFAGLTNNRLVRYTFNDEASNPGDMGLKGDLAESWQASPDHRVWTFKLRQGVKWHNVAPLNGREFVAADVKYCFEQYAKEGVQSFNFKEIEGIETPDKYTVRLHLTGPNTLLAQNLAEPVAVIFSREVLEEDGDLKKRAIGTGPFTLKEHTRKVRLVLARNPDYFDKGKPFIDEYIILSTPDDATRKAALRSGQTDFIWVASPSEVETLRKSNPNLVVQAYHNTLAPFGLALASDKPPYNDVRVRRAISMAIDRQKQVDTVYEGHGMPGWGVPYIYYQDKAPTLAQLGPWWQYKPAEAKKLLAEAGHGNGFSATLFYYEYFPQMSSQVQLVQQDLKRNLNIDVKITKLDYTGYYGRYVEGKWDGMSWGFQSGHAVGLDERTYQYMHSKSTKNFFRVNDPVIDELTTKLRQTPVGPEQRAMTKKIVDREFDQAHRLWMPYDNGFLVFQPHVRNASALALRRTDGYGSPAIARVWLDK
ncbi:MAG TPA: ABC transporter substrate-binding protein [Candidatus Limnocylindrales bacterium]|nr:ABC transporter substrate-binding protein [Candidatus Limnocylindrales bacterium]